MMTRNRRYAIIFVLLIVIVGICLMIRNNNLEDSTNLPKNASRIVQLGGKALKVMVADTPDLRSKGLSGREGLAQDEGMLFVFDSDQKYRFWMKDMRFPIDILWVSARGEVVDVKDSVSPSTYPSVFAPSLPSRYVLELSAGFAKANGVVAGDILRL